MKLNRVPMKKKFLGFLLLIAISMGGNVAFASSYQTYFYLEHEIIGPVRYFDGQNITFEASPHTYPRPQNPDAQPANSFYTATLYRYRNPFDKDEIGTVILPRSSLGKALWTNVGPGSYYIFFKKEKDRMVVTDDNATMYNS